MNKQEIISHIIASWLIGTEDFPKDILMGHRKFLLGQLPDSVWPAITCDENWQPADEKIYDGDSFEHVPQEFHFVGVHRFGNMLAVVVDNGMPPSGCLVNWTFVLQE